MRANNHSSIQATPKNYFQNIQDKYQKTIDTSDSYASRAFAAIGQLFNKASARIHNAEPLETRHYHKSIDEGNTKISPVTFAILTGVKDEKIIELIKKGAVVDSFAYQAFQSRNNSKSTLAPFIYSNLINEESQRTDLMQWAAEGNFKEVKGEISFNASINTRSPQDGRTALSFACESGSSVTVKILIENGANIHLADKNGKTPLMYAAQKGDIAIMKLILDHKNHSPKNIDIADKDGMTALMFATKNSDELSSKLLTKYGANTSLKMISAQSLFPSIRRII